MTASRRSCARVALAAAVLSGAVAVHTVGPITPAARAATAQPAAGPVSAWPRSIPARLKPQGRDDLVVTTLGDVKTPLADGVFDPVADRMTTSDGRTIHRYYRDHLDVPFYHPIDKTHFPVPPSGWCSWYYYYWEITPEEVLANARWVAKHLKPYGAWVVQVDDGWQGVGHGNNINRDWTTIDARFRKPGMQALARSIRELGLTAGIWLAPHGQSNPDVVRRTNAFLLKPDGSSASDSWEGTFLLDPTSSNTRPYLIDLFKRLRAWGYSYFKIDGQPTVLREYGRTLTSMKGPLPSGRPDEVAAQVYRPTLAAIREAIGPDSYLLGCWGIPMAAMGLVNGSRTAGDVVQSWDGFLIAAMAVQEWNFLHNIAWYSDPDILEVRPPLTDGMARAWATIFGLTGQALMASDRMPDLPASRLEVLRRVYPAVDIRPLDLYRPDNILKPVVDLKVNHAGRQYDVVGVFNHSSERLITRHVPWRELGLDPKTRHHVYDFWSGTYLGAWEDGVFIDVPPADVRVLTVVPVADRPVLISTSRHITQGWVDLVDRRDSGSALSPVVSGRSRVVGGDPYRLTFGLPPAKPTYRVVGARAQDAEGRPVPISWMNHLGSATATIEPGSNGSVSWSVQFGASDMYVYPVQSPGQIAAVAEGVGGAALRWRTENHVRAGYRVEVDGAPVGVAFSPNAAVRDLVPGRAYRLGVRSIWFDGSVAPSAAEVQFTPAVISTMWLSDLAPDFIRQDWRNLWQRLGAGRSVGGSQLTVAGRRYARGVGSHSGWDVHYDLAGAFAGFHVEVGVDDEVRAGIKQPVEVQFEVWGDGRRLWSSGAVKSGEAPKSVAVDVTGVRDLALRALPGADGYNNDHADWLEARLTTAGALSAPSSAYDVRAFGAAGDGQTLDTAAINRAIEAAAASGGGTVHFPAGTYLSTSIHLRSHVALYLDQGATIEAASPERGPYDDPEPNPWDKYQDFGHSHWHNSLIWGEGVEGVSILGPGLIHGKGLVRGNDVPKGGADKAIALKNCRNVTIRDISILHGGHFGILATGTDNLTIDNIKIDTNRDGINVDSCKNVRISNATINSPFDDGICLKSSYGLGVARATENVTVTNCQVSGYDEGTLLDGTYKRTATYTRGTTGRIKFGTESNGGFKNITISNCVFDYSRGLAIESVDGGLIEDVTITNLTMRDIVNAPIFVRLGARARGPDNPPPGAIRRLTISHVVASNVDARHGVLISGIPGHPIEDLRLNNIRIAYRGGGTKADAALEPEEKEKEYPEPDMFGNIPAYGLFARHVNGLGARDLVFTYDKSEYRPAFLLHDVRSADLDQVRAQRPASGLTFVLRSVWDFALRNSPGLKDVRRARVERDAF